MELIDIIINFIPMLIIFFPIYLLSSLAFMDKKWSIYYMIDRIILIKKFKRWIKDARQM